MIKTKETICRNAECCGDRRACNFLLHVFKLFPQLYCKKDVLGSRTKLYRKPHLSSNQLVFMHCNNWFSYRRTDNLGGHLHLCRVIRGTLNSWHRMKCMGRKEDEVDYLPLWSFLGLLASITGLNRYPHLFPISCRNGGKKCCLHLNHEMKQPSKHWKSY